MIAEYIIDVGNIEELQMTNDQMELEEIFSKAHRTVVQGGTVQLMRKNFDNKLYAFDKITTEKDLDNYKRSVFKYL